MNGPWPLAIDAVQAKGAFNICRQFEVKRMKIIGHYFNIKDIKKIHIQVEWDSQYHVSIF